METFGIIFQTIACLLALLAAAILLWINEERTHSKKMLIFLLLILALLNLNGVLFHLGWYIKFPQFHKILIPFSLLVGPLAYLYTRSVLKAELKFRKSDWLLWVPTLLFAINLLPYYLMPLHEKGIYLAEYYQKSSLRTSDSEGILPAYVFSFIRFGWSLLFITLNYQYINRFKAKANDITLLSNKALLKWLTQLNSMLAALVAAALFAAIIAPIIKTTFNLLDIALGTFVLVICLNLFVKPRILYGVFHPGLLPLYHNESTTTILISEKENGKPILEETAPHKTEDLKKDKKEGLNISQQDAIQYKTKIETFFKEKEPFLNPEYTLEQLVSDIQVPRYIVSAFINREYGIGFRDFLNKYRVEYLISNLNNLKWKQFTLEAISNECGFSSRSNFIKHFKEVTGQTPSEYIKNSPNGFSIEGLL